MAHVFLPRELPSSLAVLTELALDLRWTWSHASDIVWKTTSPELWDSTRNPWTILEEIPQQRLEELAVDASFQSTLQETLNERATYYANLCWWDQHPQHAAIEGVAFFSMEFGLGEGLPLYAGGLGILAGDYLKTASDLGIPLVGVGLLYQEGYFRQFLNSTGNQHAFYPFNDPTMLPIRPLIGPKGDWVHIGLELPGRTLLLRTWEVRVGRATLYLLDSNAPVNSPADRGITSKLYGGDRELRFLQELVLGIGGWRLLETLGRKIDICHLNEGHAAFVVLERTRSFMMRHRVSFPEALWATRAGNVFTTHTSLAAGFDVYSPRLLAQYFPPFQNFMGQLNISLDQLLALGRLDPAAAGEPFNMAYLAMRGSSRANGVSRLHGEVSRKIFGTLFPHVPEAEVPITHITNGVHVPTWDSPWSDKLWSEACGKKRWRGCLEDLAAAIENTSDEALWSGRAEERADLVRYVRSRLARQFGQRGEAPEVVAQAGQFLDPNILTLGFARRFATYKRPNLLLSDAARLACILSRSDRPVQIVVAGKAHPDDEAGKQLVQAWAEFVQQPAVRQRAVFLEDYDMSLAQELVQGVDIWINTPRRPWEACGTSGMKVLVNGGLNLSTIDGWWAEAYLPEVGWAIGADTSDTSQNRDAREANELYERLECDIIPMFYERDADGIPRPWVRRIRASMSRLTPQFSSNRMVRAYVEECYLPSAAACRRREADAGKLARELCEWWESLQKRWQEIHFQSVDATQQEIAPGTRNWAFKVAVVLGGVCADSVQVQLYADRGPSERPFCSAMRRADPLPGVTNGYFYTAVVTGDRAAADYTARVVPFHPHVQSMLECPLILWQK